MTETATMNLLLEQGMQSASNQFYYAALEIWSGLESGPWDSNEDRALLYDEMGKAYVQLGYYEQAVDCFSKATELPLARPSFLRYRMHLAMTYRRLSEYDKAQRILAQMSGQMDDLPALQKGLIYGNLALVQAYNEFHREALSNTLRGLQFLNDAGTTAYHADLYTNLGLHHMELGNHDEAEANFLHSAKLRDEMFLPPIAELSRLYMIRGSLEQSIMYAKKTLELVWSSFINYEKEEIARLCQLLADLAYHLGERYVGLRLIEKAQLLFGKLRLWREWQQVQSIMDDWNTKPAALAHISHPTELQQLKRFVTLLDAMNAQELIHEKFSSLLDTRVLYALELAKAMHIPAQEQQELVYACRFADYGLTAVETDVVANPNRSVYAWDRYKQHTSLSIAMLQNVDLSDNIVQIVAHHHECFDGTGYPQGRRGDEIPPLVHVFAVADYYATGVTFEGKSHSKVVQEISELGGTKFHPDVAQAFLGMFTIKESII